MAIYKVFNLFGFWKNIISWVKILNTNFNGSKASEQVEVQRGSKQGDPIAPYLVLLYAEILAILMKQNVNIKGIMIDNKEHKITQYGDNTLLILDPNFLFNSLDTINFFSNSQDWE